MQPGSISLLHYSRDALSGPLRSLSSVVELIRKRQYFPDATRSGYFVPTLKSASAPSRVPAQAKVGSLVDLESDDSGPGEHGSSGSESQDLSDEEVLAEALCSPNELTIRRKAQHSGDMLYIHIRWKTLHVSHSLDSNKLACGRPLSLAYINLTSYPEFPYFRFANCFGASVAPAT